MSYQILSINNSGSGLEHECVSFDELKAHAMQYDLLCICESNYGIAVETTYPSDPSELITVFEYDSECRATKQPPEITVSNLIKAVEEYESIPLGGHVFEYDVPVFIRYPNENTHYNSRIANALMGCRLFDESDVKLLDSLE